MAGTEVKPVGLEDKPPEEVAKVTEEALQSAVGLKPSAHQVAGHRFDEGRLGSLVDDSGRFYKPLQGGERGDRETAFYETVWADPNVPPSAKEFFPKFFGTVLVTPENGTSPTTHAVMEDLSHGYSHPCIMDVKMGRTTWYDGAPQDYINKCQEKDASTTSAELGFRLAGMQVYEASSKKPWKAERKWCKVVKASSMEAALRRFTSIHPFQDETPPESSIARQVYLGPGGLLEQLAELRAWFSEQTSYHFYSSSILVVYEGGLPPNAPDASSQRNVKLRLIDFAHVIEGNGKVDSNFLEAIDAVTEYFRRIAESSSL